MQLLPIRKAVQDFIDANYSKESFDKLDRDQLIEIPNVLIFRSGVFKNKTNPQGIETTKKDLEDILKASKELGSIHDPIIKLTHKDFSDNKKDNVLAKFPFSVGEIENKNLVLKNEAIGGPIKLYKWLIDLIVKGYLKGSSAEIKHEVETQDKRFFPRVLSALALLGSERPAQWEKLVPYSEENNTITSYQNIYKYSEEEYFIMDKDQEMIEEKIEEVKEDPKKNLMTDEMKDFIKGMFSEFKKEVEEMIMKSEEVEIEEKIEEPKEEEVEEDNSKFNELKSKAESKYSELEAEYKKLVEKNRVDNRKVIEKENSLFFDGLVQENRISPAMKNQGLDLLNSASLEKVECYSEDGSKIQLSQYDKMKTFLKSFSVNENYSEIELADNSNNPEEITEADFAKYGTTDKQNILGQKKAERKVEKYAEENSMTYSEALKVLYK